MEINGKTFFISGGGSGLGAATARALVAGGAKVVIADISEENGNKMVAELGEDKAKFVKADVSDEASVQAAVDAAVAFGELRGAINCAGIGTAEKTVGKNGAHRLATYQKVIQVNLIGTFNVLRLAAAAMAANEATAAGERGVIVNTASVAAFDGQIGQIAYSASKGGIVGMTLPAARDLASLGIRVMTIAPGIFDTPLLGSLPEPVRQSLGAQVPFPSRLGRPDEYAALAKHIIENEMLNGEVIRLDGAIRMTPR
ncbi:MAG: SDR family NAD(P)-dependent oxidoreductase [Acidobacteria bacterium]|nr:SDR family NAD(P)-dependent oxidoreductase [Acidobacteriota bacterium]